MAAIRNLASSIWRRRWRWLGGSFVLLIVGTALLIVLAPTILSWPPARQVLLAGVNGTVDGDVSIDQLSIGWTEPGSVGGLRMTPPQGPPVVAVEAVQTDRSLWELIWQPVDLGTVVIRRPEITLLFVEEQTNLEQFLGRPLTDEREPEEADSDPLGPLRRSTISLAIEDARFSCQGRSTQEPWFFHGISATAHWRPAQSEDGSPVIALEPGVLVDRAQITPGMCNDFLKYIAPSFADVATAQGEVSIEIMQGTLPWDNLREANVQGTLTLHRVEAGPGSVVRMVTDLLKMPPLYELSRDTVVHFDVHDGCVHHQGLEFGLGGVAHVESSGTVDFDGQINLLARLNFDIGRGRSGAEVDAGQLDAAAQPLPPGDDVAGPELIGPQLAPPTGTAGTSPRGPFGGAFFDALNSQTIELRITGTLHEPKLDMDDLGQTALAVLQQFLQNRGAQRADGQPPPVLSEILRQLQQRRGSQQPELPPGTLSLPPAGNDAPQIPPETLADEDIAGDDTGPMIVDPDAELVPRPQTTGEPAPEEVAEEIIGTALDFLRNAQQRRQQRLGGNTPNSEVPPPGDGAAGSGAGGPLFPGLRGGLIPPAGGGAAAGQTTNTPPPPDQPRRPLRGLLDRLLTPLPEQPAESQGEPEPAPPPPPEAPE